MITKDASLIGMTKRDILFLCVFVCVASFSALTIIRAADAAGEEITNNLIERSHLFPGSTGMAVPSMGDKARDDTHMQSELLSEQQHIATFTTSQGVIEIELLSEKAPETVANFKKLASEGFYDGTRFHRVISGFMIQGGDPLSKDVAQKDMWGRGGPGYAFADEINDEKLVAGVLAMANAGPGTNGSQFFIVTAEATPWLDGHHTAFGRVVSGMETVMDIEGVPTDEHNRPIEDVMVESIEIRN